MTPEEAAALGQMALWTGLLIGAPVLGAALLVGLVVSLLQAATQIQEQTLSFLPKLLAVAAVLVVAGPWMLTHLMQLAEGFWGPNGPGGGILP